MSLGYFVDIQGTLLSDIDKSPINGAIEMINHFNLTSTPYVLVTNNTKQDSLELINELQKKGFKIDENRFIDPLMVLKDIVGEQSIMPFGSDEFCSILPKLGFKINKEKPQIILIASYDKFNSQSFAYMIEFILKGAKPIGMHATSTYAKNGLRYPGVGAILSLLEYATGEKGDIVGKPSAVFYKKALNILQKQDKSIKITDVTMISDDALGDLVGANKQGIKTNLVLSGKCKSENEIANFKKYIDEIYPSVAEILKGLS